MTSSEPPRDRWVWLKNRSTSDLLVLMIAGTISFSVLMYGLAVAILVFVQPEKSHAAAVTLLADTFQMLVGLLAGFIAGRTEGVRAARENLGAEKDHE